MSEVRSAPTGEWFIDQFQTNLARLFSTDPDVTVELRRWNDGVELRMTAPMHLPEKGRVLDKPEMLDAVSDATYDLLRKMQMFTDKEERGDRRR